MAQLYAYNYAQIDPNTNMCINVQSRMTEIDLEANPDWVEIPVNDINYLMKYYINGEWYEDAAGTIPWQSSLI